MKISKILIICLHFLIVFPLFPQQELEEQYNYALTLYEQEEYYNCVTELKRLNYFDKENVYKYRSNFLIAKCYKQGGRLNESVEYFSISKLSANSIEEKFSVEIEIIKINILRRTTPRALQLLASLEQEGEFSEYREEITYWRGWTYIFQNDWKKASVEFSLIDEEHPLKKLCESVANEEYSVTFATVISYILPGTGQIYTGNYFSGILSLGWNLLFGYFTVNAFIEQRIFDALAVMNLLWLRFYAGNVQNAKSFAEEANIKIYNEALDYLQHHYKGLKP